jgi:hypothetical protein
MLLLLHALLYLTVANVRAVPVSLTQPTSEGEPPYGPRPSGRGTVDILLSSITTLILCVYTSIHLNITPQKRHFGIRRVWVYKFYWVLIAIVAPEFVLYSAYQQWQNARALCKQLEELDGAPEEGPQNDPVAAATGRTAGRPPGAATESDSRHSRLDLGRIRKWSDINMVSAFYIVMGGFAYEVHDMSDDLPYIALTPEGFLYFAKAKLITPDVLNDQEIADKSKADSLGKFLVCVQALWLVVNCIARKASGMATTLVELNVIVHVVVTILVYGLWWHKPLAVGNPTHLLRASANDQSAETSNDGPKGIDPYLLNRIVDYFQSNTAFSLKVYAEEKYEGSTLERCPADANHSLFEVDFQPYIPDELRFEIRSPKNPSTQCTIPMADSKCKSPAFILVQGQQLVFKEHRMLVEAPEQCLVISKDFLHLLDSEIWKLRRRGEKQGFSDYDWLLVFYGITTTDPWNVAVQGSLCDFPLNTGFQFMAELLSCVYAGCHATAWSSHFPTYIERWIWRASCIILAAAIPILSSQAIVATWILDRGPSWAHTPVLFWSFFLAGLIAVPYILARLYIPVEAFIATRSLPLGAFDTVDWAQFWPHV